MTSATAAETVQRAFKPIQQFTRGWMMAPSTDAYGTEIGMRTGAEFRIVGRAGVLGSCTATTAHAALAYHPESQVAEAWHHLPAGLSHYEVAERYKSKVLAWGEEALAVFDPKRMQRLNDLGRRIAEAAPNSLGPIFAGWREFAQPENLGARVALTTQVLREMRGAAHLNAIISVGITPLDAMLASTNDPPRTGPDYARRMGFAEPFRNPDEVRSQRLEAEVITATIMESSFGVLDGRELADFGELVETTRNAIDM